MDRRYQDEISAYFCQKAPVLFLILSSNGVINHANRFATVFTGRQLIGKHLHDIIIDFSSNFNLKAILEDPSNEQLVNIENTSGLPQSFYMTFRPEKNHILAFGRIDVDELEVMRREVLELNRDLNNLNREIQKKMSRLKGSMPKKINFLGWQPTTCVTHWGSSGCIPSFWKTKLMPF